MEKVIIELEKYLICNKDDYTELEINIEKLIEEYKKLKEELKAKDKCIIELVLRSLA